MDFREDGDVGDDLIGIITTLLELRRLRHVISHPGFWV